MDQINIGEGTNIAVVLFVLKGYNRNRYIKVVMNKTNHEVCRLPQSKHRMFRTYSLQHFNVTLKKGCSSSGV